MVPFGEFHFSETIEMDCSPIWNHDIRILSRFLSVFLSFKWWSTILIINSPQSRSWTSNPNIIGNWLANLKGTTLFGYDGNSQPTARQIKSTISKYQFWMSNWRRRAYFETKPQNNRGLFLECDLNRNPSENWFNILKNFAF